MAQLAFSFLGSWQVSLHGRPVKGFESNKVRALVTYLAIEADRLHYREALAGMLWPDMSTTAALANLRPAAFPVHHEYDDPIQSHQSLRVLGGIVLPERLPHPVAGPPAY